MNNKIKTWIILTPGFPKDEDDTTCLPFLQQFVREIDHQFAGLRVVILAFDYPFKSETYPWKHHDVIPFNGWQKSKLKKVFKWVRIWRTMKKIKRNSDLVGVLSLWCTECALLGNRFAKRNGLLHFCWIQGQDAKKGNKYVQRIKPPASALIAISNFLQTEFEKNHFIRPVHVIPVGISPEEFPVHNLERDIDILGVGSLIPLKQYGIFVESVYELKKTYPGVKAILCGKGPEADHLQRLIEQYGLQENIRLTGELPHQKVLLLMKRSKVFLHPSNYEGLGVVCIEALYAGCHVISFVQPIHYDIEQWHIVQTKEAFTEQAAAILHNPSSQYKSVLTFTARESVEKIMQLYNYSELVIS
jgi:glycosyltransferase involved in cell wall biosynthesis